MKFNKQLHTYQEVHLKLMKGTRFTHHLFSPPPHPPTLRKNCRSKTNFLWRCIADLIRSDTSNVLTRFTWFFCWIMLPLEPTWTTNKSTLLSCKWILGFFTINCKNLLNISNYKHFCLWKIAKHIFQSYYVCCLEQLASSDHDSEFSTWVINGYQNIEERVLSKITVRSSVLKSQV